MSLADQPWLDAQMSTMLGRAGSGELGVEPMPMTNRHDGRESLPDYSDLDVVRVDDGASKRKSLSDRPKREDPQC
jgi:hypothetical protein